MAPVSQPSAFHVSSCSLVAPPSPDDAGQSVREGHPACRGPLLATDVSALSRCRLTRHQCLIDLTHHKVVPCAGPASPSLPSYHCCRQPPPLQPTDIPTTDLARQASADMMETMDRGSIYDHDIPSLSASLEAFDPERSTHSAYSARSNMHSSRWSVPPEHEESEAESEGPWAPPAWQKSNNHWYRKSLLGESGMRASPSRSPGFDYRSDREITPSRIPLPESPRKGTPRTSPEPMLEHDQRRLTPENMASRLQSPSVEPQATEGAQQSEEDMALSYHDDRSGNVDGCRYLSYAYLCVAMRD